MKRVLLLLLMQCSLIAFCQEKLYVLRLKQLIFYGSLDYKSKIVQTAKDGQTTRTLLKINNSKPEPMIKYMITETDSKGRAVASSYMLSKDEIKPGQDIYKFSISSYDVIYNDANLIKANQEASKGKSIIVA